MRIGELAQRVGVTVETIRYYERARLIPEAVRTRGGFRLYTSGDVQRLRFILAAKRYGFSLAQIRVLVLAFEQPDDLARGEIASIIGQHREQSREALEALTAAVGLCERLLGVYDTQRRDLEQHLIDSLVARDD